MFIYLSPSLSECFTNKSFHGLLVWNVETGLCFNDSSMAWGRLKGKRELIVRTPHGSISFLPELSPLPMNHKNEFDANISYRVFDRKRFEAHPTVLLFGESIAHFDRTRKEWIIEKIRKNQNFLLPWMGFKLELLTHRQDAYPVRSAVFRKPINGEAETTNTKMKAIEIEIDGVKMWAKSTEPYIYESNNTKVIFEFRKKTVTLPYEITLNNFKIETNPGTNVPASFESAVAVFRGNNGMSRHRISMNHPLKMDSFTFYQASYSPTSSNSYNSVLSVNFDPGRPWKYFGSLLLVVGSIWHYFIRRKRNRT